MRRIVIVLALLGIVVLGAGRVARADVPDMEVEACEQKQVGDACDEPSGGACAMATCSKARPGPDGHVESHEWSCMRCVADAPRTGEPGNARIIIGVIVGLALIGVAIGFALRKSKQ